MAEDTANDYCPHEHLEELEERISELQAQASNETALYGDAGPGAYLHIKTLKEHAEEIRRSLPDEEDHEPTPVKKPNSGPRM